MKAGIHDATSMLASYHASTLILRESSVFNSDPRSLLQNVKKVAIPFFRHNADLMCDFLVDKLDEIFVQVCYT